MLKIWPKSLLQLRQAKKIEKDGRIKLVIRIKNINSITDRGNCLYILLIWNRRDFLVIICYCTDKGSNFANSKISTWPLKGNQKERNEYYFAIKFF